MDRRDAIKLTLASALCAAAPARGAAARDELLAALEASTGGRLGVHALLPDDSEAGHRSDERFALCSTFKLPLAALLLREADAGKLALDTRVAFSADDLVPYAPVVEANLERGEMSVAELARAALTTSDNVAANLLLACIGGPVGFTARLRELGDAVTRLDRTEPTMNLVPAGEVRDTTTPRAMATLTHRLLFGDALSAASRGILRDWMLATTTGKRRLTAGFDPAWRIGHKTGTGIAPGIANKYNDVAVAWRDGHEPLVIAAYFEADGAYPRIRPEDERVLARVASIVSQQR